MKTRKTIAFILLAVVLVITGLAILHARSQPPQKELVYHGKSLDGLLEGMDAMGSGHWEEISNAVTQMGPAAVPFIFQKLEQNDSFLVNTYRDLWPKLPAFLRKRIEPPKPITFNYFHAMMALRLCGSNSMPLIVEKLQHRNPAVREAAWEAFEPSALRPISTNEIIALVLPALKDTDALVRTCAAYILGRAGAAASNCVPALIPLLSCSEVGRQAPFIHLPVHADAAYTLGRIGPAAASAVPALTNLFAAGDGLTRIMAAIAVWRITSNENPSLNIIINELPILNQMAMNMPMRALEEMGPRAKPAFPVLIKELSRAKDPYLPDIMDTQRRIAITNALKAIDPEAAAKAGMK